MVNKVFAFKISLDDSKPNIWRRILVSADYSFFDLHVAIQNAMGWSDSHLHSFEFARQYSNYRTIIQFPNPENDMFLEKPLDEGVEKIKDYFGNIAKRCKYIYDFGDNWTHTILFEGEKEIPDNQELPVCVAGKNACPFEDSGGIWGYQGLLKILRDPKHEQHDEMAELVEMFGINDPQKYDPTYFDPKKVEFENPGDRLKEYEKGFRTI